jgi:hypothetical protein
MDDACKKLGDAGLFKSVAKAVLDGSLGCKDFLYAYMLDATRNLVRPLNRWRWSPVVKKFACLLLARNAISTQLVPGCAWPWCQGG